MNETPNTRIAELFNAMAGAYETWAEPLSARLSQVALGRTTVSAGDCVLDIGAGTGALSLQAAALGASVTAIDLSSVMVARLNQRLAPYPKCKALVMDGQALTFEEFGDLLTLRRLLFTGTARIGAVVEATRRTAGRKPHQTAQMSSFERPIPAARTINSY